MSLDADDQRSRARQPLERELGAYGQFCRCTRDEGLSQSFSVEFYRTLKLNNSELMSLGHEGRCLKTNTLTCAIYATHGHC